MASKSVSLVPLNRKMAIPREGGCFLPRVTHRPARGKRSPRFIIRCGCCNAGPVEIYYDDHTKELVWATFEINGVNGSVRDWRNILLPLLGFRRRGNVWADKLRRS